MAELTPGSHLSHYRILEKIGEGGMGEVHRAWDERLDRPVAIKSVGVKVASEPGAKERLVREARIASALNHPNVCVIHEVSDPSDLVYIVMEFVEGRPLSDLIPMQGLPVPTLLRYGTQIADALAHAHERGVVHRDLKSANVVVTPEGRVKVLDFGLAARHGGPDAETAVTRSAAGRSGVAGTLPYMAPEVLRGEPAGTGADLWALGVMLHEMAAARHPFEGRTAFEVTAAILRESPADLPARIPAGLRSVIRRCLIKEPGQRYQHAGEIRAALEALGGDAPRETAAAGAPRRRGGASGRIRALAVLPLENLSGDAGQEYFADGMTEALIAGLAKIGTLRVISRTTVMAFKGVRRPLPEIASELSVDAIVEGTVTRSGDQVRISVQLVRGATDRHLWAETYDRPMRDVLSLQSDVARAIAQEVRVKLTPSEKARLASRRAVDPAAYEAYLRGRFAWNKRTEAGIRQGIEYFGQAIEKDPTYAQAHAGLADCYNVLGFWGGAPAEETFGRAKVAAGRALDLDGDLAEAHCSLAYAQQHYDRDWIGAERGYRAALRLDPGYPTGHHFQALLHLALGRREEAAAGMEKAGSLDPLSKIIAAAHGWILYFSREYDRAVAQFDKALDLHPGFWVAREWRGRACAGLGRHDEAIAECRAAVAAEGSVMITKASLAHVLAIAGRRDEAREILIRIQDGSRGAYVLPYAFALVHAGLGETDAALDRLEEAEAERGNLLCYLGSDPGFDSLRGHPRFRAQLKRVAPPG